jgi:hypothetical protein
MRQLLNFLLLQVNFKIFRTIQGNKRSIYCMKRFDAQRQSQMLKPDTRILFVPDTRHLKPDTFILYVQPFNF